MEEYALEVKDLIVEYGNVRAVDSVSFFVRKAEHLTLLGPSGSGKTSILRGVAGLEPPHGGEIKLFGKVIFSKKGKINVPVAKRGMNMVFQSYAIWPHMTVFENVAYPLKVRKMPKKEVADKVKNALTLTGMAGFEERPASKLSGGQQQRIAFARAIVADPELILLDEPLSNLDAKLRARMRVELKQLQESIRVTSMYVTHDQEEAFVLSDRIILLKDGKIEQEGAPEDIYRKPRTRFVAEFIPSANLFHGRVAEKVGNNRYKFEVKGNRTILCNTEADIKGDHGNYTVYSNASLFSIGNRLPQEEPNTWMGRVKKGFFVGDYIDYKIETEIGEVSIRSLPNYFYEEGSQVMIHIDPDHCHLLSE